MKDNKDFGDTHNDKTTGLYCILTVRLALWYGARDREKLQHATWRQKHEPKIQTGDIFLFAIGHWKKQEQQVQTDQDGCAVEA